MNDDFINKKISSLEEIKKDIDWAEKQIFVSEGKRQHSSWYNRVMKNIKALLTTHEQQAVEKQRTMFLSVLNGLRNETYEYEAMPEISADFSGMGGMKIEAGVPFKTQSTLTNEEILENSLLDRIIKFLEENPSA